MKRACTLFRVSACILVIACGILSLGIHPVVKHCLVCNRNVNCSLRGSGAWEGGTATKAGFQFTLVETCLVVNVE